MTKASQQNIRPSNRISSLFKYMDGVIRDKCIIVSHHCHLCLQRWQLPQRLRSTEVATDENPLAYCRHYLHHANECKHQLTSTPESQSELVGSNPSQIQILELSLHYCFISHFLVPGLFFALSVVLLQNAVHFSFPYTTDWAVGASLEVSHAQIKVFVWVYSTLKYSYSSSSKPRSFTAVQWVKTPPRNLFQHLSKISSSKNTIKCK